MAEHPYFDIDLQSPDLVKIERDVLDFWQSIRAFEQSLEQSKHAKPYTFYDGPPFATGLPHHGHLLASTIKDIIPRYQTMNGHHVKRRFGWDCHGLPIEHEIDKTLGQTTQAIVEEQGITGYNQHCRSIVGRYVEQWQKTITRLGRWVDFDDDYKTMDTNFMESVWWVFGQLWEQGLIYQGSKVVPFSTALSTVLSNFEASSNYQDVQDPAIMVLCPLLDEPRHHVMIWTTTPWTLPANCGICVGPDIDYNLVTDHDRQMTFYVASSRCQAVIGHDRYTIIKSVKGSALVNLKYRPPFDDFNTLVKDGCFRIFADPYVSTEDGTGMVHMAPAFGEDDQRIMQAHDIDVAPCPIDDAGLFTDEVPSCKGQYIKDADKTIISDLKQKGLIYRHDSIVHSYPFCPRSDTPLIYRAIPSWYVNVQAIKASLIKANQTIDWVPKHIQHGRFGQWLHNARDWAISRNRVWGTPIPLWQNNETGQIVCISSKNELETLTQTVINDLHRDHIDELTFSKPNEPGIYRRINEVLDCWFESGAMPYAQRHYPFEEKNTFDETFPADFIAEGLDQTRGWFYTLNVLAVALKQKPAFKHVIVSGIVAAHDGKKMSKRLKNYTAPDALMSTHGADALRLYLINSGLVKGEEQRFNDNGLKDHIRSTLLPWLNAVKFLVTYAQIDQWQSSQSAGIYGLNQSPDIDKEQAPEALLDRWLLSQSETLKINIERHMDDYALYAVVPDLLNFIERLTNTYIRLNRDRFWAKGMSSDKQQAFQTLWHALMTLTTCMAPFTPMLAEALYQQLAALSIKNLPTSVHWCRFPKRNTRIQRDAQLEKSVDMMMQIILLGRQKRNDERIKIKIPLRQLRIIHDDADVLIGLKACQIIIQTELNVKHIDYHHDQGHIIQWQAKPNSPVLGKRLGKRFSHFKNCIQQLTNQTIQTLQSQGSITIEDETFTLQDILIIRSIKPDLPHIISNGQLAIELDMAIDEALMAEGLARSVISQIQKARKHYQFDVTDRITLTYHTNDERLQQAIKQYTSYICNETLAVSCQFDRKSSQENTMHCNIEGIAIEITLKKAIALKSKPIDSTQ